MNLLHRFSESLTNFIYPNICYHCERKIGDTQYYLCHSCWSEIKLYNRSDDINYLLDSRLKGKLNLEVLDALFLFQKKSPLQTLLHELKYEYKPHIGEYLGQLLGEKLLNEIPIDSLTGILPIPLHTLKLIERGYNQAEQIAIGVKKIYHQSTIEKGSIIKKRHSQSQTKKNRIERWSNLTESFSLNFNSEWLIKQSHILIIDDVITTGATIESIGRLIQDFNPNIKISVATIAVTE